MSERATTGSAARQAAAWGGAPADWAEVMEGPSGWGIPAYERILERVGVGEGTAVLDVGCGAGRFCRLAADRGARVSGLDATGEFIAIAAERVPEGSFEVGDMEDLPWPDDSFDVITGFNSFFLAAEMVGALSEARRVARPGGKLALTIFGRPERCDSTRMFAALQRASDGDRSDSGEGGSDGPPLHAEEVISGIARKAGLEPVEVAYLEFEERYPDLETMARGVFAAPPGRRTVAAVGREQATQALREAMAANITESGEVALREELRYLIATT